MNSNPLNLAEHIKLRKALSTVSKSSLSAVWKASPKGKRFDAIVRFLKLHFGVGKLSSDEFIQFGFCEPKITFPEQLRFAGKQAQQAFNLIYNDKTWYAATKHKMLFETMMNGAGIPCPKTIAMYDRKGRGAGAPVLKNQSELEAFLRTKSNFPIFAKPTTGLLSIGSFRIDGIEGNNLRINGTHLISIEEVIHYIKGISKKGYLFQTVLLPHSKMVSLNGAVIASARFLIFNFEEEASIHSCVLKLPAKNEVADNFWREGSVLCDVDCDKGTIERANFKHKDYIAEMGKNHAIYKEIIGFELPDFEDAKKKVVKAARHFAGIKVQSWDVAFTKEGPVMLEINYGGDLNLTQLASGKGVMTEKYCQLLRQSGYGGSLPE